MIYGANEFILNNKKSTTSDTSFLNPFWVDSPSKNNPKTKIKKITKVVLKWLKLLIYAFLLLMGLWGCFQSMAEPETKTSVILGQGLEFGYLPFMGVTDPRYVLSTNGLSQGLGWYGYSIDRFSFDYGPFYAFFVWPGASLVLSIMYPLRDAWGGMNALLAIFVLLFIIRVITLLISIRSSIQTERMQEIQGKQAEINAKYKGLKDRESVAKKQQELKELYAKYDAKPFASFEQIFITLPIFLIVYRVVTILRPLKACALFGIWDLSQTPMNQIFSNLTNGGWVYIFFILIVIPVQIVSQKLPQILSKKRSRNSVAISKKGNDQIKKTKTIQNVMMVFLIFIVVSSATGIGLYWFLSSLFSIAQTLIIHKLIMNKRKKGNTKKTNKIAKELGIDL